MVAESATLVAATVATIEFQSRHPVFYNQATTFRRWGSCYRCYHATNRWMVAEFATIATASCQALGGVLPLLPCYHSLNSSRRQQILLPFNQIQGLVNWSSSLEYNKTPISSCSLISNGMVAEYATIATVHSAGSIDSYRCYHSFIHQTVAHDSRICYTGSSYRRYHWISESASRILQSGHNF